MRHFAHLSPAQDEALFHQAPQHFDQRSPRELLALALGATLYTPGTKDDYAGRLGQLYRSGVTSSVLCLEDAVADTDLVHAERNVVEQLKKIADQDSERPLLFVRVRRPEQVEYLSEKLGETLGVLTGFTLPKFTAQSGAFLEAAERAAQRTGQRLYVMPILESEEIIHAERRVEELAQIRALISGRPEQVLAVRIGATDLCGLYGLRRTREQTIYDIAVVRDAIASIVNVFGRDNVVTGAVWEHFTGGERLFKPQLRESPFSERSDLPHARKVRKQLVDKHLDGLLREVTLDKATGIIGKTIIHPSHVVPVHSLYAVSLEEYEDARATLAMTDGGVTKSSSGNKMLESKPHARWAHNILLRSEIFGVLQEDRTFVDLLDVEDIT